MIEVCSLEARDFVDTNCEFLFKLQGLYIVYDNPINKSNYEKRIVRFLDKVMLNLHCVLDTFFPKFVIEELSKPKTAVIVPETDFDFLWDVILNVSSRTKARFHHNLKVRDKLFTRPLQYKIEGLSNGYIPNVPLERLKVLVSSGIYGVWIKYEKFLHTPYTIFASKALQSYEENDTEDYRALSFDSSDIA
ncbi:unnamed protein product, partial [Allacma fusca]